MRMNNDVKRLAELERQAYAEGRTADAELLRSCITLEVAVKQLEDEVKNLEDTLGRFGHGN